ncbi:hypothetical protein PRIPAC_81714, partial [Pristionchus pacificus]|uniref:Uncharacterized protein n=1 Tax=Pristionchus pacificus TaxID=54126 RepID=A0A2A6CPL2_PRIPA
WSRCHPAVPNTHAPFYREAELTASYGVDATPRMESMPPRVWSRCHPAVPSTHAPFYREAELTASYGVDATPRMESMPPRGKDSIWLKETCGLANRNFGTVLPKGGANIHWNEYRK